MATPHVSGVAALIWSLYPEETRDDIRNKLRDTADDLGEVGFDPYYGYGRVNAKKAVASLEPNIAITDVSSQKTIVGQGFTVEIYVGAQKHLTSLLMPTKQPFKQRAPRCLELVLPL